MLLLPCAYGVERTVKQQATTVLLLQEAAEADNSPHPAHVEHPLVGKPGSTNSLVFGCNFILAVALTGQGSCCRPLLLVMVCCLVQHCHKPAASAGLLRLEPTCMDPSGIILLRAEVTTHVDWCCCYVHCVQLLVVHSRPAARCLQLSFTPGLQTCPAGLFSSALYLAVCLCATRLITAVYRSVARAAACCCVSFCASMDGRVSICIPQCLYPFVSQTGCRQYTASVSVDVGI